MHVFGLHLPYAFLAACFAIIIALVPGTFAAPAPAIRSRAAPTKPNVTEILMVINASKPPSSPQRARQSSVELSPSHFPRAQLSQS